MEMPEKVTKIAVFAYFSNPVFDSSENGYFVRF